MMYVVIGVWGFILCATIGHCTDEIVKAIRSLKDKPSV